MSTHARPLAVWLAAASDSQLSALFAARGVPPDQPWQDFFDAAEALLEPTSIDRALPRLTATEAEALWQSAHGTRPTDPSAAAAVDSLVAQALLRPDGSAAPPVAAAVAALGDPGSPPPTHACPPATDSASAIAAEQALTTVSLLADLLLLARDTPLALLANGTATAGEKRRLADAGISGTVVDDAVALAVDADLFRIDGRHLRPTREAESWLQHSAARRWAHLAEAFRDALPRGLRSPDGGWIPPSAWEGQHPWDPRWPERSALLRRHASLLGLLAADGSEPAWAAPLRAGGSADPHQLDALLPTEVERLFLQNDLSAIAPGPLSPALDVRLRAIAHRESAAQASSYRFTSESISYGLLRGESAASILAFLGELSVTGIPQPLEYLVTETALRHGLVRVRTDELSGRTRVSSTDAHLIEAISVDQRLRPLGLTREGGALGSRVGRDTVHGALREARYPALLVDAEDRPLAQARAPEALPVAEPVSYEPLVTRLRARQGPDADAAWLDRELETAVRTRSLLRVEVGMPDGSTRELLLEASGLGGGRLRGRDRAADVERTLPVSSIRSARVVDPGEPTPE